MTRSSLDTAVINYYIATELLCILSRMPLWYGVLARRMLYDSFKLSGNNVHEYFEPVQPACVFLEFKGRA